MSRFGKLLLERHWDIVKVAFPSSVLFGFVYTLNNGTSPLQDARQSFLGSTSTSNADVFTIRFSGSVGHREA